MKFSKFRRRIKGYRSRFFQYRQRRNRRRRRSGSKSFLKKKVFGIPMVFLLLPVALYLLVPKFKTFVDTKILKKDG